MKVMDLAGELNQIEEHYPLIIRLIDKEGRFRDVEAFNIVEEMDNGEKKVILEINFDDEFFAIDDYFDSVEYNLQ